MPDVLLQESGSLFVQSSQLRAMARMFERNGDFERPDIAFNAVEQSGLALLLVAVADQIDSARDRIFDAHREIIDQLSRQEEELCHAVSQQDFRESATKPTKRGYTLIKKTKGSTFNTPTEPEISGARLSDMPLTDGQ